MTLFDGATMAILKEHGGDYGLQRMYATLGIVILTPISGSLIDHFSHLQQQQNYNSAFYFYFGLKSIASAVILLVNLDFRDASNRVLSDFRFLMHQPEIIAFITVMLITGTSFGLLDTFLFWLLQDLGAKRMLMGLTVAVGGLAGIPILVAADPIITRLGHANTIVIGTAFYVLRFVGYSFLTSPWWCMPLETLECMTVALLTTAAVSYAAVLATPATLATLQGVNGGVHYGVGRGLGSLLGGFLVGPLGVRNTFRMMAGVCAITSVLYFLTIQFLFPRLHGHSKNQTDFTQSQRGKARQNAEGPIHRRDLEEKKGQKTNMKRRVTQEKELERRVKQESSGVESNGGEDKEVEKSEEQETGVESNEGEDKEVEKSEEQEIRVESNEGEDKEVEKSELQETGVESNEGEDKEWEKSEEQETGVESNEGEDKEVEKSEEQETGVESNEGEMIQIPGNDVGVEGRYEQVKKYNREGYVENTQQDSADKFTTVSEYLT
ncbi:hypothetical protein Pcinc_036130 [Petrolisthes cinctipes]|uniref:Major facilitator superfamily associated domain-containing protein n=1 Tax=Petrolisthes cinctipes TaxID=88211 RepID=A0AAE1BWQ4_PETCI|nr:hypothetical protein Pcinc_036130 [Petrolisthes cinctipes]